MTLTMETETNVDTKNVPEPEPTSFVPSEINKILPLPASAIPPTLNYPPSIGMHSMPSQYHPYMGYGMQNIPQSFSGSNYFNQNYPTWNLNYQRRNPNAITSVVTRMAEDKMKPTFRSIEMILQTFNSFNMILESTYSAIHGSFRTITNVADHLIFIRNHLAELALIPRLANVVVDFLKWLLKLFGIKSSKIDEIINQPANTENLWNEALRNVQQQKIGQNDPETSSLWPVLVFFSVVLGTPYIVWRLLGIPDPVIPRTNQPEWTLKNGRHFTGVALYDFKARNQNELSFKKGKFLFINPETLQPGAKWLMACTVSEDNQPPQIGLVPLSFVKLLNK